MAAPLFELVTELQTLIRRDFSVADESSLNPLAAKPFVEGEWLEFDGNYKLARGSGEGTNPGVFPIHTERGRYDTQAIKKVNVLMFGMYEADTQMVDTTSAVLGSPVTVQDVTVGGIAARRGLKLATAGAGRVVVGYVSKLFTSGPNKLRIIHFGNVKM